MDNPQARDLFNTYGASLPLFQSEEDKQAAGPQDTRILDTDFETVAMIKELLETRVRLAIMEDGGDVEYRGFSDEGFMKVKPTHRGHRYSSCEI